MDYSVLTVTLNAQRTVRKTVDSVLSQSVLPKEYLFVDGGSDDGTLDLLGEAVVRARELGVDSQLLHQQTVAGVAGIPDAWNTGLRRVTADIVFILNADDWYDDPATAHRVIEKFSHAETDIIVGETQARDDATHELRRFANRPLWLFPVLNPLNHPACFVRRSVYSRYGDYSTDYYVSSDYEFLYRCYTRGASIARVNDIVVSRLLGGFATRNRDLAREETRRIGVRYAPFKWLPRIACFARSLTGR